jgi:hypothetical protein
MKDSLWVTLPVPEDHLGAIGQVVIQWAYFEYQFDEVLSGFLMQHPEAKKLTIQIPSAFNKRVSLFRDAANACFNEIPSLETHFVSLANEGIQLRRKRDHVAHGRWFTKRIRKGPEEIGAYLSWRGRDEAKILKLETLEKLAVDISRLTRRLFTLTNLL